MNRPFSPLLVAVLGKDAPDYQREPLSNQSYVYVTDEPSGSDEPIALANNISELKVGIGEVGTDGCDGSIHRQSLVPQRSPIESVTVTVISCRPKVRVLV